MNLPHVKDMLDLTDVCGETLETVSYWRIVPYRHREAVTEALEKKYRYIIRAMRDL